MNNPRMSNPEREAVRQQLPRAADFKNRTIQMFIPTEIAPGGLCLRSVGYRTDTVKLTSKMRQRDGTKFWAWTWPDGSNADWDDTDLELSVPTPPVLLLD